MYRIGRICSESDVFKDMGVPCIIILFLLSRSPAGEGEDPCIEEYIRGSNRIV